MKQVKKPYIYRNLNQEYHSKTQSGMLYFFEKIIRSHPLIYFISRSLIRFTNIFEEDFEGVKKLNFDNKINILDIGASDGIASKFFNKNLNVESIVCVEPNSYYVDILKKINLPNLFIVPYAIGSKNSYRNIYFPRYKFLNKNLDLITYTHYDKKFLRQQIYLDFKFRKKIFIIKRRIFVKKINLKNKKVDLIKIDTNGFELPIVQGIINIIKKNKPAVIIESNQDIGKIENILKRFNYKSYSYETKIKKLRLIQSKYPLNTFFLQKKHLLK